MAVIYKVTNLISKKVYIGETKEKNPFDRWRRHINKFTKNSGCPALRDAVKKYGLQNFKFEILFFCFDDDRFKFEIQTIEKYNSLVPNGYNISKGGYGGGFINKKHTPETIKKIKDTLNKLYDNEDIRKKCSEKSKKILESIEIRNKIKDGIKNSEKWKKALEEKRVGGHGTLHTEEIKIKIRNSVNKYYAETIDKKELNIIKHRESMAKATGILVKQYSLGGILLNTYPSMSEAARQVGINKTTIGRCISGKFKSGKQFIWTK